MPVSNPQNVYGVHFESLSAHSSFLTNERIAYLFVELDFNSKTLNETYSSVYVKRTKSTLYQIWKNIRVLVQNSATCRQSLRLTTKVPGLYTLDMAFQAVDAKLMYCEMYGGYTMKRIFIMTQELNNIEIIIRSILQYFSYNFRPSFKQKPDVVEAAINIKRSADKLTVEQLREVVGPNNAIDFSSLGLGAEMENNDAMKDDLPKLEEEDEDG
jgi:hypothetical protein